MVSDAAPLIIIKSKSDVCMAKNGKDTKHTGKFSRRIHSIINVEECNMDKTVFCEGGLMLEYIVTNNAGEE